MSDITQLAYLVLESNILQQKTSFSAGKVIELSSNIVKPKLCSPELTATNLDS